MRGVVHSFDDTQEHLEQLLAFPQVSIGDHCGTMLENSTEKHQSLGLGIVKGVSVPRSSI